MSKGREVWRYEGENVAHEGWFIAFLDSAGCLSVQSDFGDYAYRWSMAGMPTGADGKRLGMREWVADHLGRDPSYVLGKISSRSEFDDRGSAAAVRKELIDRFESHEIDEDTANEEWDLVDELLDGARSGDEWIRETTIEEPWHFLGCVYPQQARAFMERVFPRIVAAAKADLERERAAEVPA